MCLPYDFECSDLNTHLPPNRCMIPISKNTFLDPVAFPCTFCGPISISNSMVISNGVVSLRVKTFDSMSEFPTLLLMRDISRVSLFISNASGNSEFLGSK